MSLQESDQKIKYKYRFIFENGEDKHFFITIRYDSASLLRIDSKEPPEWTKLKNFKCKHCPLNENEVEYCPVAMNIVDVIEVFKEVNSYERVQIEVNTNQRSYQKETTIQDGVSGLMGILMVTSGCPIMAKLKPLVRFHLPFATLEETELRVFSTYLLAQYIKKARGEKPDWDLNKLKKIYDDINELNRNVVQKIADHEVYDTNINAVSVLNNFANDVHICIGYKDLDELALVCKEMLE